MEAREARTTTVVIGGGIVGLAVAYKLTRLPDRPRVVVLEKESSVCRHQSGHNSGVLHAGLYYSPGSLKARLAVDGIRQMKAFCRAHDVPHEECGKLVVATSSAELPRLDELERRGVANGLRGLERVGPERAREREPHVRCLAALVVPEEGIVDYPAVCRALAREIVDAGGEVVTNAPVTAIAGNGAGWRIATPNQEWRAARFINCAGLHSDRVASLAGVRSDVRIVPFRGEYFELRPERRTLVNHLVYPVPDPAFPFLGVHFTRMIGGGIEAGPNAVLSLDREGYRKWAWRTRDARDALLFRGLWRFLARYPRMVSFELRRSLSRRVFCQSLQALIPEIQPSDLVPGGVGIRAQAMRSDGQLINDFQILERPNALHVLNAPSPGATASLAIADVLIRQLTAAISEPLRA